MHERGLDLQTTANFVEECKKLMDAYFEERESMRLWGKELDADLGHYFDGLGQWVIANMEWSFETNEEVFRGSVRRSAQDAPCQAVGVRIRPYLDSLRARMRRSNIERHSIFIIRSRSTVGYSKIGRLMHVTGGRCCSMIAISATYASGQHSRGQSYHHPSFPSCTSSIFTRACKGEERLHATIRTCNYCLVRRQVKHTILLEGTIIALGRQRWQTLKG